MVLSNTDRGLIGMEVCLCMGVCVSLGDRGSVGSQGERAAVSRRGRPRVSTAVLFGVVI